MGNYMVWRELQNEAKNNGDKSAYKKHGFEKGPAVCRLLHCGTCYLIAVLAHLTRSGALLGGERFRGPGLIPGRFWRTGVPSFRRCLAVPLHSGSVKDHDVVQLLH